VSSRQINFGSFDFRERQKSLRLFAREVMPPFADTARPQPPVQRFAQVAPRPVCSAVD
jgi:hypothetical protein